MTLANWLTVVRITLIPFFVTTLIYRKMLWAFFFFILAALTDVLDGFIARRTRISTLGRYLDPTADKLLLVSAFILLPIINSIPVWVTVIVVSRDVMIALGYLIIYVTWGSTQMSVRPLGKITTFVQAVCVALVILGKLLPVLEPGGYYLALAVAVITAVSGLDYIVLGIRHANALSENHGTKIS